MSVSSDKAYEAKIEAAKKAIADEPVKIPSWYFNDVNYEVLKDMLTKKERVDGSVR